MKIKDQVKTKYRLSLEQDAIDQQPPQAEFDGAAADRSAVERRTFLKMAGFSVGAGLSWGCTRGEDRKLVPFLVAPEEVVPGRPYWYASVCGACPAGCGVLAKNLDGRPVKLEGNPDHPVSQGGLCAIGQASVLALYDAKRLAAPLNRGQESDWSIVAEEISAEIERLIGTGARVRFLTDSCLGPTDSHIIEQFLDRFEDGRLVIYDSISSSAIAEAHALSHGIRSVPRYHFDKADFIVSFDADFLGTWISPVEHTRGYRAGRRLDGELRAFSYHAQFESHLSLTGSNADRRVVVPPGGIKAAVAHLADTVARRQGRDTLWSDLPESGVDQSVMDDIGRRLTTQRPGRALIVCGENDRQTQLIVNHLNHMLGAYDAGVVDLEQASLQRRGDDQTLLELRDEMARGEVDALCIRSVNPVYELPFGQELAVAMDRISLVVCFSDQNNETAQHAAFVCPEPHFLEAWSDSQPVKGVFAIRQPVLRPIGATRTMMESLARWTGAPANARDIIRENWRQQVFGRATDRGSFRDFWDTTLHDGWTEVAWDPVESVYDAGALAGLDLRPEAELKSLLAVTHASLGVFDGRHAHNAWLHEMPDPITKMTWDNFAAVASATALELGLQTGDEVRLTTADGVRLTLPVLVQPGLHRNAVAVALGYGRKGTDRFTAIGPRWLEGTPTIEPGGVIGANAAPLIQVVDGNLRTSGRAVTLEATGVKRPVGCTQQHHSLYIPERLAIEENERRDIVRETTVVALKSENGHGEHVHDEHPSLWEEHAMPDHHWGMSVDLNACTGCSACVVSCQAENNIPVVGRDEVVRSREMHWMRIDRYYAGEHEDVDVVFMPMMCQHCDNAPCETVCPVQATAQSAEGLNQQIYNRCVGTRYCANNCPYKVRRFNWFNYPRESLLQNMALNPDVTIRTRGVMEKCSLCVQRIQYVKLEAKREGRPISDGEIEPACAQSCPAKAIVFGDLNDPESRLATANQDPRQYQVLAELGVKPVVSYLKKVRNRAESGGSDERS